MSKYVKLAAAAALAMGFAFAGAVAPAKALTIELDTTFSTLATDTPGGTAPWLVLEFEQQGDPVLLTMQASLAEGESVDQVYLNYSGANLANLVFDDQDTSTAPGAKVSAQLDSFQADGDGKFDILFEFPPIPGPPIAGIDNDERFEDGEISQWLISASDGSQVLVAMFESLSVASGAGNNDWWKSGLMAAAHIQSTGASGTGSAWIAPGPTPIPLPAGLLLFLSGLFGIGVLGRYKAKRSELPAA